MVPAVVVAEWWRSARGPFGGILRAATVEPVDDALARIAGEALAELGLAARRRRLGLWRRCSLTHQARLRARRGRGPGRRVSDRCLTPPGNVGFE